MLRIRRIYDNILPVNKSTLSQVQEILRSQFTAVDEKEIDHIAEKLRNPFKQRFRTILFVAESIKAKVRGFAMLLHEPVAALRLPGLDRHGLRPGRRRHRRRPVRPHPARGHGPESGRPLFRVSSR